MHVYMAKLIEEFFQLLYVNSCKYADIYMHASDGIRADIPSG
jgi:hypothetical protein